MREKVLKRMGILVGGKTSVGAKQIGAECIKGSTQIIVSIVSNFLCLLHPAKFLGKPERMLIHFFTQ